MRFVDFNREDIQNNLNVKFMLSKCEDKFIFAKDEYNIYFLNLTTHEIYDPFAIANNEETFKFFEKKDDENYLGILVVEE